MPIRKIVLVILVILVLLVFNIVFNAIRIDLVSFENSTKRLLKKSEVLIKKAKVFDEKAALQKLGMNKINKFYYRFDDHMEEATCQYGGGDRDTIQESPKRFSLEFNIDASVKLVPTKGKIALEDGILKFTYIEDGYVGIENLDIVKEHIGEIELRMKLKEGKRVKLSWSFDESVELSRWRKLGEFIITTIPDNKFHIYRINAARINATNVSSAIRERRKNIKKLFFQPLDTLSGEIEIDYIRFISKKDKYVKKPYGETYEKINEEMRKALYTNTPLSLKYALDIPEGRTFLKFGMGILQDNDPVRFRVLILHGNEEKEAFSKEIINANEWQDAKLDLSELSGKKVEISLQTDSAKGNVAFWSNPIIYTPPKEKFNVIIVLEDALRADHMSCYGYPRKTTPVKDKFVKKGILFLNAFSQSTGTAFSCLSIMTSLYPTATGARVFSEMLSQEYLTLPEIMRSQGFATASFIQNPYAGPKNGLHQGFSNLFDDILLKQRAKKLYGKILYKWIEANIDRNFFLYFHLLDPHARYDPPRREPFDVWYREAPPGEIFVEKSKHFDPEWVERPTLEGRRALYDGEVLYNDFYFGKFLEKLRKYGLLQDTLIIHITDHGEHLGEHGLWGHMPPGYIQVLHVPMFMVCPAKIPEDVKITQPVQLIDIVPTILDLARIDKANFLMEGDSLLSLMHGQNLDFWDNRLCISEEVSPKGKYGKGVWASVFYKNWHIINSKELTDRLSELIRSRSKKLYEAFFSTRVFDYLKDKKEECYFNTFLVDIFFKNKVRHLLRKLEENNVEIWRALTQGAEQIIKYDPDVMERLRALGYLQ